MKIKYLFTVCILSLIAISCDVEQTKEAELPEVDVDVESGQMPAFDVDWATVDVGTRTTTVTIPKVRVIMEEEEVEIPYIDFDMPDEGMDMEEMTLAVEAEVSGTAHEVNIEEIYATNDRLYVISRLNDTGESLGDEFMRVSDRVIVNVPDDLNVKHYIIGKRLPGQFNKQYSYITSKGNIKEKLKDGKVIYRA